MSTFHSSGKNRQRKLKKKKKKKKKKKGNALKMHIFLLDDTSKNLLSFITTVERRKSMYWYCILSMILYGRNDRLMIVLDVTCNRLAFLSSGQLEVYHYADFSTILLGT